MEEIERSSIFPVRDKLMVCLSFYQGMRAMEIAYLDIANVTDVNGRLTDEICVKKTKGTYGKPRTLPMHAAVGALIQAYIAERGSEDGPLLVNQYGGAMSPNAVEHQIGRIYRKVGLKGASSHSGRRSFITQAAREGARMGCSLKDVQHLAGHADLKTTEEYIELSPHHVTLVSDRWAKTAGAVDLLHRAMLSAPQSHYARISVPRFSAPGIQRRARATTKPTPPKRTWADYIRLRVRGQWLSIPKRLSDDGPDSWAPVRAHPGFGLARKPDLQLLFSRLSRQTVSTLNKLRRTVLPPHQNRRVRVEAGQLTEACASRVTTDSRPQL